MNRKKKIQREFKMRAIVKRMDYFRSNTKEVNPISYDEKTQEELLFLTMLGFPLKKSAYQYTDAVKKYPFHLTSNVKPVFNKKQLLNVVYFPLYKKYLDKKNLDRVRVRCLIKLTKAFKKLKMI